MQGQQKQSHQVKALLLKNIKLQARQPCTNICQILTPIICLVFTIAIRNIAVSKIPTDNDSIYNNFPTIPQKFNNFTLEDLFPQLVNRSCQQWYSYQVKNQSDLQFIGHKDGTKQDGLLGFVKNTFHKMCKYNLSKVQPHQIKQFMPPIFINANKSVNVDIFDTVEYFNDLNDHDLRKTSAIDKIADGAITFKTANPNNLEVDFKINDIRNPDYHRADGITRIRFYNNKSKEFTSYYSIPQGLMTLQDTITTSYIQKVTTKTVESGFIYMPFLASTTSFIDILVNTVTTILFPISLSLLLPVFLYLIVLQKQEKLIQMMRMNGMKMRNYWLVNFIFNFGISVITNLVFFLFGYFFMENPLFHQTSKEVLFVVLLGWILAQIGMATFFQVFLASSRAANIIGYLISIWTNLIGATISLAIYQYPRPLPIYFLIYPTFAFNRMFYLMFTQCSADRCYTTLSGLPTQAAHCIVVLYVSFIVFQLLGMYLFEVVPQQYGTRQPLNFPIKFLLSKFKPNSANQLQPISITHSSSKQDNDESAKNQRTRITDIVQLSDYPLVVSGLRKIYDNGKQAVKGMDLIIEDHQVFGLLGPNGAGKTTLISMITGVFQCTQGDCFVAGHSIKTQLQKVHINIGVCPQFDILWPQLTVQEHLYFYTRLRGTPTSLQSQMVKNALEQVNLTQFKTFKSSQLSGGMKRRLSVGISMVGNPRIVFLDQPTTGLDPQNRRNLWNVLNRCRQSRALFLTTHLMEQADALCNRIGIITQGVLRTVGTQQKLKKIYGNGYFLSLNLQMERPKIQSHVSLPVQQQVQQSFQQNNISSKESIMTLSEQLQTRTFSNQTLIYQKLTKTKIEAIKNQIFKAFPHSVLDRQINGYLRFNLGNIVISEVMAKLGESQTQEIRNNWGLTNSNLQDVFLTVVKKFDLKQEQNNVDVDNQADIQEGIIQKSDSLMSQEQKDRHSIQH